MKKELMFPIIFVFVFIFAILSVNTVHAAACNLDVSLINQDPYPAIPGDYVKTVFQLNGLENKECGKVSIELKEQYPFSLDPNVTKKFNVDAGTHSTTFSSFFLANYRIRVDRDAIDGDNPIEVVFGGKGDLDFVEEFQIYVEDTKADFEIYVKDYNFNTKELTFEVLNIEDADIEALTVEIPKQEGFQIKGPNRVVVGDLDANEFTTANFEANLGEGETTMNLNLIYTDSINVRREIQKQVVFDSEYFTGRSNGKKSSPIIWIIILGAIGWFFYRRWKKNKIKKLHQQQQHAHHEHSSGKGKKK